MNKDQLEGTTRKLIRFFAIAGLTLAVLAGCDTLVGGVISTVDRAEDKRESESAAKIYEQSVARYKAMADRGDPKGIYYMAYVHAAEHRNDPDGDAFMVKRLYEEAVAKGSNDAKVALGRMLTCGDTGFQWTGGPCDGALPKSDRDPQRGLELLKQAAQKSCSVTEPLMGYENCREREVPIARFIWLIYRDGKAGLPKDPAQETYWAARDKACQPEVNMINKQRGC